MSIHDKFRIHVLGVPHTKTNHDFTACAYTQKVYKFCKMMHRRGHHIVHYGVEGSNPECSENVDVVSAELYERVYGCHDYHSRWFRYDVADECYQTFFKNAIQAIDARKEKNDILLPFWGSGVRPICDAVKNVITIEPGIGYAGGSWARFKVFESYAIYHAYCGTKSIGMCQQDNYHVVIPNYFDLEDFRYNPSVENRVNNGSDSPYFLFVGRVYDGKGVNIAIQVCEKVGVKLKIAGQLDDSYRDYKWPENVEFVGYCDTAKRSNLMANAVGSFVASQYLEPFGGVQIENLLCGTPTITSDWGAFSENNVHGVTGYRCRTFNDYCRAALDLLEGKINPIDCRKYGERFSLENIAPLYEKYFTDVKNIYENNGWYQLTDDVCERLRKRGDIIGTR